MGLDTTKMKGAIDGEMHPSITQERTHGKLSDEQWVTLDNDFRRQKRND